MAGKVAAIWRVSDRFTTDDIDALVTTYLADSPGVVLIFCPTPYFSGSASRLSVHLPSACVRRHFAP